MYKRTLLLAVHLGPTIKIRLVLHHVPYDLHMYYFLSEQDLNVSPVLA